MKTVLLITVYLLSSMHKAYFSGIYQVSDKGLHLLRGADADGVAEGDFVAAHLQQGLGDPDDFGRLDSALVRASAHA